MTAWVENSKGEILARNRRRMKSATVIAIASKRNSSGKLTEYPLPSINGSPHRLRLVALVSGAEENDSHARVIATLLALLLGAEHPAYLQPTPLQRAIYDKRALGLSNKEIAFALGISHSALRVHLTRMRNRFGDRIIPRHRRRTSAAKLR